MLASKKSDTPSQINLAQARLRFGLISDPSFSNYCVMNINYQSNMLMEKEDFTARARKSLNKLNYYLIIKNGC
ncbi:MAG TPA: hypothetical protein VJG49_04770 [Candidatus Nanoarchaeia archaeon]|nr:hypothetical protein [Candidatus Nanoarchaeia archaeon]